MSPQTRSSTRHSTAATDPDAIDGEAENSSLSISSNVSDSENSDAGLPQTLTSAAATTIATSIAQPAIESNTRWPQVKNGDKADKSDKSDLSAPLSSEHHTTSDEDLARRLWSPAELVEVRARERTFDGAYWRTSIGLFGASLIILRVFGLEFFPVGLVFLVLGLGFLAIGLVRRHKLLGCTPFADEPVFVTSGGTVLLSAAMCVSAYVVLLVLLVRI
ncbi:hypothetical protein EV175_004226 [Coemansia sp. RSA 1933]|nr:hypothetical protein EV175_004226 [Coemansia sp. RSA 1933]